MQDLIEAFLSFKQHNRGRAERTSSLYRHALERLVDFFGDRNALQATHEELVMFCGPWLHKKGVGPRGRRPYVAAIRGFYAWAKTERRIEDNPAFSLPYPASAKVLPRVMTLASAEKLMWAPDFNSFIGVRDGAILALLAGCGLRVSGVVGLNQSDVIEDAIDGKVRLIVRVREKKRERKVPLPAEADLMLRLYLEHPSLKEIDRILTDGDQVLFVSVRNPRCPPHEYHGARRRLTRYSILEMINRYGKAQGIPEEQLHPHAMRHLFGTELAEDNVDVLMRQQLMGHEDPKSTEIYTHLAMRKLTRETDRANPLGKIKTPVSDLLKRLNAAGRTPKDQ